MSLAGGRRFLGVGVPEAEQQASSTSGSDSSGSSGGNGGGGGGGGGGGSGGGDGGGGGDEGGDDSLVDLFAVLAGAHSVGKGVFGFLAMRDGNELRQLCRLIRGDVAAARWRDAATPIKGPLAAWRACFPGAVAANVYGRKDLGDADFVHLVGVKVLNMGFCTGITDAGLAHLAGIHTLDMYRCTGVTDAGLAHLTGIRKLTMWGCAPAAVAAARTRASRSRVHVKSETRFSLLTYRSGTPRRGAQQPGDSGVAFDVGRGRKTPSLATIPVWAPRARSCPRTASK